MLSLENGGRIPGAVFVYRRWPMEGWRLYAAMIGRVAVTGTVVALVLSARHGSRAGLAGRRPGDRPLCRQRTLGRLTYVAP